MSTPLPSSSLAHTSTQPPQYRPVGIILAVGSGVLIGSSFVLKKKGLLKSQAGHEAGEGVAYLKSFMWWTGMIMMICGELCNFGAYAVVEAILVTPLGALSVVICAILSHFILKEKLTLFGWIGCTQCILGSIIIALNGPREQSVATIDEFKDLFLSPLFLAFGGVCVAVSLGILLFLAPKYGKSNMLCYIVVCSLIGGLSVSCTQGLGSCILTSIRGDNQFKNWFTYFLLIFVTITLLTEIYYLNVALALFNTAMVTPTYYVLFTFCTLLTSTILYQGFKASAATITTIVLAFFVICTGIFVLQMSKIDPRRLKMKGVDEKTAMLLRVAREEVDVERESDGEGQGSGNGRATGVEVGENEGGCSCLRARGQGHSRHHNYNRSTDGEATDVDLDTDPDAEDDAGARPDPYSFPKSKSYEKSIEATEEPGMDALAGRFGAIGGTVVRARRRATITAAAAAERKRFQESHGIGQQQENGQGSEGVRRGRRRCGTNASGVSVQTAQTGQTERTERTAQTMPAARSLRTMRSGGMDSVRARELWWRWLEEWRGGKEGDERKDNDEKCGGDEKEDVGDGGASEWTHVAVPVLEKGEAADENHVRHTMSASTISAATDTGTSTETSLKRTPSVRFQDDVLNTPSQTHSSPHRRSSSIPEISLYHPHTPTHRPLTLASPPRQLVPLSPIPPTPTSPGSPALGGVASGDEQSARGRHLTRSRSQDGVRSTEQSSSLKPARPRTAG